MYCPFSSTVHDFRLQCLHYPQIFLKERFQLFNHRLFLLCAVAASSKTSHWGQKIINSDACGFQLAVAKQIGDFNSHASCEA